MITSAPAVSSGEHAPPHILKPLSSLMEHAKATERSLYLLDHVLVHCHAGRVCSGELSARKLHRIAQIFPSRL